MRLRAALLVLVALTLGGCGVGNDSAPRALSADGVPFSLLGTSSTTTTPAPAVDRTPVSLFLVDNESGLLVEVERSVAAPSSVEVAIRELLRGPTEDELARGLRSSLPRSTELLGVQGPTGGLITIDLNDLTAIGGQGQRLALAQIVFTATAVPEVDRVIFEFEGEASEVPDGQGESTAEPLTRGDFAIFDPSATTIPAPPPEQAAPTG